MKAERTVELQEGAAEKQRFDRESAFRSKLPSLACGDFNLELFFARAATGFRLKVWAGKIWGRSFSEPESDKCTSLQRATCSTSRSSSDASQHDCDTHGPAQAQVVQSIAGPGLLWKRGDDGCCECHPRYAEGARWSPPDPHSKLFTLHNCSPFFDPVVSSGSRGHQIPLHDWLRSRPRLMKHKL